MKKFLRYSVLFGAVGIVVLASIGVFNYFQLKKKPKLEGVHTIFMGDSRVMTGVNDGLISGSRNLAQNTESYLVTYYKLKAILPANKGIHKIVLGFSYHSFSGYLDHIYKDDLATNDIFERIYPIMKPEDFGKLSFDSRKYYKVLFKRVLLYPRSDHFTYLGEFVKLKYGLDQAKLPATILRHYYTSYLSNIGISTYTPQYLDSIVNISAKYKAELILLNIPLHKDYLRFVPSNFVLFYNKKKMEMMQRGIKVLDYSEYPMEDKYFKDYNHLDLEGADHFTSLIKNKISD